MWLLAILALLLAPCRSLELESSTLPQLDTGGACESAASIILQTSADEELGGGSEFAMTVRTLLSAKEPSTGRSMLDMLEDTRFHGTVFWPKPAAFFEISDELNSLGLENVANLLQYHISPRQAVTSEAIATPQDLATLGPFRDARVQMAAESPVRFTVSPVDPDTQQPLAYNLARVEIADTRACNSVVHVIDRVLVPPELE